MNANGIKAADHDRIADELQQLLDEQAQLRAALAEQNVDPELIDRIRYCVDTVIKAGEEPRQRGRSGRSWQRYSPEMEMPTTSTNRI